MITRCPTRSGRKSGGATGLCFLLLASPCGGLGPYTGAVASGPPRAAAALAFAVAPTPVYQQSNGLASSLNLDGTSNFSGPPKRELTDQQAEAITRKLRETAGGRVKLTIAISYSVRCEECTHYAGELIDAINATDIYEIKIDSNTTGFERMHSGVFVGVSRKHPDKATANAISEALAAAGITVSGVESLNLDAGVAAEIFVGTAA